MCTTCTTVIDTAGTNIALLAAAGANTWERLRDRMAGVGRIERETATWTANAEFLRAMGLDPMTSLGPPPVIVDGDTEPDPDGSRCELHEVHA